MASGDVHLRRIADVPGRITDRGLRSSNATLTDPPAVAVGLAGQGKTRGTVALTLCRLSTNQSIALLKANGIDLRTDYLFHNLDRRYEELRSRSSGGGRGGLSKGILESVPIELPSLDEQEAIARILDTIDAAIHETRAMIAKLNAVKQGMLHDLLSCGVDANGELRPPQAIAPHLYRESPLGWLPKDWVESGLATVATRERSVIRTGPFGSSLKGEHWRESGTPVVTIGSLGDGEFITSELLFVDEGTAKRLADFALIPGDLVFSRVADVGRSVVVSENEAGWIMSSNFMRISCDTEKARPHFLQLLLSHSTLLRRQLRSTVNSGGRDVANSAVLLGLRFPWPTPQEQDSILERVRALNSQVAEEQAGLSKLINTKSGLMDDLLTGRVRVTPLLEHAAL
jgi:type I restriction enzyme S subunit